MAYFNKSFKINKFINKVGKKNKQFSTKKINTIPLKIPKKLTAKTFMVFEHYCELKLKNIKFFIDSLIIELWARQCLNIEKTNKLFVANKKLYESYIKDMRKLCKNKAFSRRFKIKFLKLIINKYIKEKLILIKYSNSLLKPYIKRRPLSRFFLKYKYAYWLQLERLRMSTFALTNYINFKNEKKHILNYRLYHSYLFDFEHSKLQLTKQPEYYSKGKFNRFLRAFRNVKFNEVEIENQTHYNLNNFFMHYLAKKSRKLKKNSSNIFKKVPWWWAGSNKQYKFYSRITQNSYLISNISIKKIWKTYIKKNFLPWFIKKLTKIEQKFNKKYFKIKLVASRIPKKKFTEKYSFASSEFKLINYIDSSLKQFKKLLNNKNNAINFKFLKKFPTAKMFFEKFKVLRDIWKKVIDKSNENDRILRRFYWVAKKFNKLLIFNKKLNDKLKFKYWYMNFITSSYNLFSNDVITYYDKKLNNLDIKLNKLLLLKQTVENTVNKNDLIIFKNINFKKSDFFNKFNTPINKYNTLYDLLFAKRNKIELIKKNLLTKFKQVYVNPMLLKHKIIEEAYNWKTKNFKKLTSNSLVTKALNNEFKNNPNSIVFRALNYEEAKLHLPIFSFLTKPKLLKLFIKSPIMHNRIIGKFIKKEISTKALKTRIKLNKQRNFWFNIVKNRIVFNSLNLIFFSLKFRQFILSLAKLKKQNKNLFIKFNNKQRYQNIFKDYLNRSEILNNWLNFYEFNENEDLLIKIHQHFIFNLKNPKKKEKNIPKREDEIKIVHELTTMQKYNKRFSMYYHSKGFERFNPAIFRPKYNKFETYNLLSLYKDWFETYFKKDSKKLIIENLIKYFPKKKIVHLNHLDSIFFKKLLHKKIKKNFKYFIKSFNKSQYNKKLCKKIKKYKLLIKKYKFINKHLKSIYKYKLKITNKSIKKLTQQYLIICKKYKKYQFIKNIFNKLQFNSKFLKALRSSLVIFDLISNDSNTFKYRSVLNIYDKFIKKNVKLVNDLDIKSNQAYNKHVVKLTIKKCIKKLVPKYKFIKMWWKLKKLHLKNIINYALKNNEQLPLAWYKNLKFYLKTYKKYKNIKAKKIKRLSWKKKWRYKRLKKQLEKQVIRTLRSPKPIDSQTTFFSYVDGRYWSYWVGRLIGMFTKKGLKHKSAKYVYQAFLILKYELKLQPQKILIELLNRLKPIYKLQGFVVRRTQVKTYPRLVRLAKRYLVVLTWIRFDMLRNYDPQISIDSFVTRFTNRLLELRGINLMRTSLWQRRDEYNKESVSNYGNLRYIWRKRRQKLRRRY